MGDFSQAKYDLYLTENFLKLIQRLHRLKFERYGLYWLMLNVISCESWCSVRFSAAT